MHGSIKLNSTRKPNKIWVGKGSEFYNSSFKNLLKDNDIETYPTHNERKFVVAERFIKTLKNKKFISIWPLYQNIYIYIYIDKLDDIVNKFYQQTS